MSSSASIKGHPLHSMLVAFPIGLLGFSLVADVLDRLTQNPSWSTVAFYTLGGGLVGALLAAVPGLVDLVSMRDPQAKRIGITHMVTILLAVGVFAVSFFLRWNGDPGGLPFALSFLGVVLLGVGGWLGGEMVYVHGVAVQPMKPGPGSEAGLEMAPTRYVPEQSTKHRAG
jgi:uncharacterized membrane protein